MRFKELASMPLWRLWLYALDMQFDTLIRISNRARDGSFLGLLRFFFLVFRGVCLGVLGYLFYGWRAEVFFSFQAWFRCFDDDVDFERRDAPRARFFEQRRMLMRAMSAPEHTDFEAMREDVLLIYAWRSALRKKLDLRNDFRALFAIMQLDAETPRKTFTGDRKLFEVASRQDEILLNLLVRLFDGNTTRFDSLMGFHYGIFTQIDWLEDFREDVALGILRVSQGDAEIYKITFDSERHELSGHWDSWYFGQVNQLTHEFGKLRGYFGKNFGGVFRSKLTGFVFEYFLMKRFERSLERLVPSPKYKRLKV